MFEAQDTCNQFSAKCRGLTWKTFLPDLVPQLPGEPGEAWEGGSHSLWLMYRTYVGECTVGLCSVRSSKVRDVFRATRRTSERRCKCKVYKASGIMLRISLLFTFLCERGWDLDCVILGPS
jgi:hypothetical protein